LRLSLSHGVGERGTEKAKLKLAAAMSKVERRS
jgi:hypothetical protein